MQTSKPTRKEVLAIAAEAVVHPSTVVRYLRLMHAGAHRTTVERMERALVTLGLTHFSRRSPAPPKRARAS